MNINEPKTSKRYKKQHHYMNFSHDTVNLEDLTGWPTRNEVFETLCRQLGENAESILVAFLHHQVDFDDRTVRLSENFVIFVKLKTDLSGKILKLKSEAIFPCIFHLFVNKKRNFINKIKDPLKFIERVSSGDLDLLFIGPIVEEFSWYYKTIKLGLIPNKKLQQDNPVIMNLKAKHKEQIAILEECYQRRIIKSDLKPWSGSKDAYTKWQHDVVRWLDEWIPGKPQLWLYGDSGCYKTGFIHHLFKTAYEKGHVFSPVEKGSGSMDYSWEGWDSELYSIIICDEFVIREFSFNKWKLVAECSTFKTHHKFHKPLVTKASVPMIMISNREPLDTADNLTDFEKQSFLNRIVVVYAEHFDGDRDFMRKEFMPKNCGEIIKNHTHPKYSRIDPTFKTANDYTFNEVTGRSSDFRSTLKNNLDYHINNLRKLGCFFTKDGFCNDISEN